MGSSIVRGGAAAFTENLDLFLPNDGQTKDLVRGTLSQVVAGIDGREDLFTNESFELVFKCALQTAAENAGAVADHALLQELIRRTLDALTTGTGSTLFERETVAAVLRSGLEVVGNHGQLLGDPDHPESRVLAAAISALSSGLALTPARGGRLKELLSRGQWIDLARLTFLEVARHPEQLLGDPLDQVGKSRLAQIIGCLAEALGNQPGKLVTGESFVRLAQVAIRTTVLNADKLIDPNAANVRAHLLCRVIAETANALLGHADPRGLAGREMFLALMERILPVASANLDGFPSGGGQPVRDTIRIALDLGSATLQNRINGANLPFLIEGLLRQVLRGELSLTEPAAVQTAAEALLRGAGGING